MSAPTRPRPATATGAGAEMATIHPAFRRELRLVPALLRSVRPGDRDARAWYVDSVIDILSA